MRLIKLTLRNFKGLRSFDLDARGGDVTVYGDNATGKTTLADAFMWLLFDKDSQNRKDFQIKTLSPGGEPIHGLEHEVEAELELADGRRITLRKVFKEQWTKRRGSAEKQFTGHTTDYFLDGVPTRKAEYDAFIAGIADEKLFRLLTDPAYYNEHLHWQERRRLLLEVCGDVTDAEVIASDPALAELPAILGKRSLDDHRKVVAARRREINEQLNKIPVRIDEVTRNLPAGDGDKVALEAQAATLRERRAAKQEELVRLQSGGQVADLQRRLREVELEMLTLAQQARAAADQAVQQERARLAELHSQIDARRREVQRLEGEITDAERTIQTLEPRIESLRQEWFSVNEQQPELTVDEACPACGQALPAERVAEARERALADFNARKAKRLEEIQAEGKRLRARVDELRAIIEQRRASIEQAEHEHDRLEAQAAEAQARIDQLRSETPDVTQEPEYVGLTIEKQQVEEQIAALRAGNAEALERVVGEIRQLDAEIAALEAALSRIDQRERGLARIEELKAEERRLAAEFEDLEQQLYLMEQFTRAKVRLLEERINGRFRLAHFQLFRVLVNGAVEECCETTFEGVPYSNLNHGARLNVGLDIINTLAEHYGFAPPVWIDNAESVTRILPTRGQQIRLVVSAADQALRVETSARIPERIKEAV